MPHTLAPTAHATLLRAAAEASPHEACGLLLGEGAHIHSVSITANVHPEPATRFEIDPLALIAAHRDARGGGPEVLGYWHSHPNGLAQPSAADRASASGDGRIWAIVADGAISLWVDHPNGFVALPYMVQDG